jgi:apolipoprotein N-acyltransferase
LVPLLFALDGQSPRRAALLGWGSGTVAAALGLSWLSPTLRAHGGLGTTASVLCVVLVALHQAGSFAISAWLAVRAQHRGWPLGPTFALALAAGEVLYPVLFPWAFAAALHELPALLQLAELGGASLVTLLLYAVNTGCFELALSLRRRERPLPRSLFLLSTLPLAWAFGQMRLSSVDRAVAAAPKAEVQLLQANWPPERALTADENRRHHAALAPRTGSGPAPNRSADLVVWGEAPASVPLSETRSRAFAERVLQDSGGIPTLFGIVLARETGKEELFNSALLVQSPSAPLQRYDKQRLLPFAEYLPFAEHLPILRTFSPASGRFTPGLGAPSLRLGTRELAVFLCYEALSPSLVNHLVRAQRADLLINLTNDGWFGDSAEPWMHLALSKFRAIEHRRFLVRATTTGASAVIDPAGRVLVQTPLFQAANVSQRVAWLRPTTLFERCGAWLWWPIAAVPLLFAFAQRAQGRPSGFGVRVRKAPTGARSRIE